MAPAKIKFVVSFSSQDERHKVSNLLLDDPGKRWLSDPEDRSGQVEVVVQLEKPCQLAFIDIGVIWCASIEVRVGKSDWPQNESYLTLVPLQTLMSPIDTRLSRNTMRTCMFSRAHFLAGGSEGTWDRVQIVCRQPWRRDLQLGLSFLKVRSLDTPPGGSADQPETSAPAHRNSVADIQRHFFGDKGHEPAQDSGLRQCLQRISSSAEDGSDHPDALPRVARMVLKAQGQAKVSQTSQPDRTSQSGSPSPSPHDPQQLTEEVTRFLETLDISKTDIDSLKVSDLRHKFEKKIWRKLTKEEKQTFFTACQDFICRLFDEDDGDPPNTTPRPAAHRNQNLPEHTKQNGSKPGNGILSTSNEELGRKNNKLSPKQNRDVTPLKAKTGSVGRENGGFKAKTGREENSVGRTSGEPSPTSVRGVTPNKGRAGREDNSVGRTSGTPVRGVTPHKGRAGTEERKATHCNTPTEKANTTPSKAQERFGSNERGVAGDRTVMSAADRTPGKTWDRTPGKTGERTPVETAHVSSPSVRNVKTNATLPRLGKQNISPSPGQTAVNSRSSPVLVNHTSKAAMKTAMKTATPTATKTATPTAEKTATPTAMKTATPTAKKTATPTATKTATPTATKTATPTAKKTTTPTATKTATPTAMKTATPTATPTDPSSSSHIDSSLLNSLNKFVRGRLETVSPPSVKKRKKTVPSAKKKKPDTPCVSTGPKPAGKRSQGSGGKRFGPGFQSTAVKRVASPDASYSVTPAKRRSRSVGGSERLDSSPPPPDDDDGSSWMSSRRGGRKQRSEKLLYGPDDCGGEASSAGNTVKVTRGRGGRGVGKRGRGAIRRLETQMPVACPSPSASSSIASPLSSPPSSPVASPPSILVPLSPPRPQRDDPFRVEVDRSEDVVLVECPLCGDLFPGDTVARHADACLGTPSEDVAMMTNLAGGADFVQCPLCDDFFPEDFVSQHASQCSL